MYVSLNIFAYFISRFINRLFVPGKLSVVVRLPETRLYLLDEIRSPRNIETLEVGLWKLSFQTEILRLGFCKSYFWRN